MKSKDHTLIFGRHPVVDAIRAGKPVDKLLLQQGLRGEFEKEIRRLSKEFKFPVQVVPRERLNYLVKGNHQGVVAWLALQPFYLLEDLLPLVYEKGEVPLFVLLDGVTDVRNFGAIARSAEICGAHGLVLPRKGSAQLNADAIKTSAGALARLPVCRESSLAAAVELLQQSGIRVLASSLEATTPIYKLDLTQPLALIVGSEGKGVHPAILRASDEQFFIPQKGETDSFNVSVAAGIMLYEVMRQRG